MRRNRTLRLAWKGMFLTMSLVEAAFFWVTRRPSLAFSSGSLPICNWSSWPSSTLPCARVS